MAGGGALKNANGTHIESLLTVLASLGGFSCQMSIREAVIKTGQMTEAQAFVIVTAKDGKIYYFGDMLNKFIAENHHSIWSLAAGKAGALGHKDLPDFHEIFRHVASTIGTESFGIPRLPEKHKAHDLPINWVKAFWLKSMSFQNLFCDKPEEWPVMYALALQKVIEMGKDVLDPGMAVRIIMETAIPMSKIDPTEIIPT